MRFLLVVLAFLVQAEAVRDPQVDAYLEKILELFKAQMPTGIPDLGIPVLDPFAVPHFDIPHIHESIIQADIKIDNFVIINLSTFETRLVHLDIEELSLELELGIADLRGDADYSLDGVIVSIFPLYGEGPMWLELYDLVLYAKAAVTINDEGYVQVTSLDLSADFKGIKLHLDNLMGGGNFGEAINNLLNALGDYIWDQLKGFLFPLLEDVLTKILNDALSSCSIVDLIENGSCFE